VPDKLNLAVLASGRGSNFRALLQRERNGYFEKAHIACLVTDQPEAGALEIAREFGIPSHAIRPKAFASKGEYEAEIVRVLRSYGVAYVILAGYMRIVSNVLLDAFPQRLVNIHPSLLPSFPGLHAQKQAFDHGVRISGCTVHLVDEGLDSGPIVAQRAVAVLEDDTEETLEKRILEQEHLLFAEAIKHLTEHPWEIQGRKLRFL
jgi:phosphoribosylglycinamide formyltransferase 1